MIEWIAGLVAQVGEIVSAEASRSAGSEGWATVALVFDIAAKGLLIVAAAGLAAFLLRGASAAVRHFVWTLAAAALVALPVFALAMPRWQVPIPGVSRLVAPLTVVNVMPETVRLRDKHGRRHRSVIVLPRGDAGSTVIVDVPDVVVHIPGVVLERAVVPIPPRPPIPPAAPTPGVLRVRPARPSPSAGAWSSSSEIARRVREEAARAAAEARWAAREAAQEARQAAWQAAQEAREAAWEAAQEAREAAVRARAGRRWESSREDSAAATVMLEAASAPPSSSFASSFPAPSAFGQRVPWVWLALALWLGGVAVVLGRIVVGAVRVHRLGSRAWCIERGWPVPLLRRLCAELGIRRPVKLLEGGSTAMPLTWGVLNPVVLLPSTAAEWPAARLETVLRHELAHVRRLDVLTQWIAEIACALHWFNPLAWLVAKRLRIEREMACDDDVLASGSPPSDYAEDLLALAHALRPAAAGYAAIAMARPAYLRDRVQALLDEERRRGGLRFTHALAASAAALLIVAPLAAMVPVAAGGRIDPVPAAAIASRAIPAPVSIERIDVAAAVESAAKIGRSIMELNVIEPAIVAPPRVTVRTPSIPRWSIAPRPPDVARQETICWGRSDNTRRTSVSRNDESYSLDWEADGCKVQVRIRGEIRFDPDFTAIAWIAPRGSVRLVEKAGSTERRLDIGSGPEGLEYTWRVDGRQAPFDAAANDWLSEMLLQLFRSTGYAASERSLWFLREHGVPGLLAEIDLLRGDHTRRVYYQAALEHGGLDATGAAQLIERAAADIRSDHELGQLLLAAGERFDFNDRMRDAFLEASRTLESDHERRRVLAAVLARGTLDAATAAALLTSAAELRSDHEKAQLLTRLGGQYTVAPALRSDFLRAAETIRSDHEKRRVLESLMGQGSLDGEALAALLDVASTIGSDHEVSTLLAAFAPAELAQPALQIAFSRAAATIDSDHSHARVLTSLLSAGRLAPDIISMVLHSALEIQSDHEAAKLLLLVLDTQQLDAERRAEFLRVLETIESEHNHGRVSSALLRATQGG